MTDFSTLKHAEIVTFAISHQEDLGASGLTETEILAALQTGRAVLETRPHGFAVVELKKTAQEGKFIPHLWLLYIDRQLQGRGLGRRFVRELKATYATEYHMSLSCYGPRRRAFFGRLGFRIESKDGDHRRMTTNPDGHQ
jgi:GNAT superfamily N-acetyltransferase